jgi:hypothetical protein
MFLPSEKCFYPDLLEARDSSGKDETSADSGTAASRVSRDPFLKIFSQKNLAEKNSVFDSKLS